MHEGWQYLGALSLHLPLLRVPLAIEVQFSASRGLAPHDSTMSGLSPEVVVALVIGIPSLLIALAGLVIMIMEYQDTRRSRSSLSYFSLLPMWRSSSRKRECWVWNASLLCQLGSSLRGRYKSQPRPCRPLMLQFARLQTDFPCSSRAR